MTNSMQRYYDMWNTVALSPDEGSSPPTVDAGASEAAGDAVAPVEPDAGGSASDDPKFKTLMDKPEGETEGGDEKKAEGDATKEAEGKEDAPAGDFEIAAPEGFEGFADDFKSFSGKASDYLKENPNASASDALKWAAEWQASRVSEAMKAAEGQNEEAMKKYIDDTNAKVAKWESDLRADKDFGGDKFSQNAAAARAAVEAANDPELDNLLSGTGLGSHPYVVKAFAAFHDKYLRPSDVLKGENSAPRVSDAERVYPNMKKG